LQKGSQNTTSNQPHSASAERKKRGKGEKEPKYCTSKKRDPGRTERTQSKGSTGTQAQATSKLAHITWSFEVCDSKGVNSWIRQGVSVALILNLLPPNSEARF
jgi:hypothetical protein